MCCRFLLLALLASAASAANWIRISPSSLPSIEIFTDSGEHKALELVRHFEMLHGIFSKSFADPPTPLRVFVFSSEREFEKYRSSPFAAANYESDGSQDFIILSEQNALWAAAAHEYLHMVMNHSVKRLPSWLEEGVAEFYSTVTVDKKKGEMRIGLAIDPHIAILRTEAWLSAEELGEGIRGDGRMFYVESWALVHMLSLSPSWSKGLPEFVKLLNEGRDQQNAFLAAFGESIDDALDALHVYLKNPLMEIVPAPPAAPEPSASEIKHIDPLDVTLTLAELALHTNHPDLARSLYMSAAKENPDSPAAIAGLGYLALAENRKADAQHQFEQAIAKGYRDAGTFFQLSVLKNDDALLEKALQADPRSADAYFLLGLHATDQGNFAIAVDHLRQAIAVRPRQFSYWNALAYAQAKQGDRQGAAESARRATLLATTDEEEQMAASLTQLASGNPATYEKRPGVVIPSSWKTLKGDARVEGTLTHVSCDASPVHLLFSQPSGGSLDLIVRDPSTVELINAEGASTILVCGEQSRPVAVEFVSKTKEITRIEFTHVVIMKR